jgi:hypothetical protein
MRQHRAHPSALLQKDAFEKRLAAEAALRLCNKFGVALNTTKQGAFCKLAADEKTGVRLSDAIEEFAGKQKCSIKLIRALVRFGVKAEWKKGQPQKIASLTGDRFGAFLVNRFGVWAKQDAGASAAVSSTFRNSRPDMLNWPSLRPWTRRVSSPLTNGFAGRSRRMDPANRGVSTMSVLHDLSFALEEITARSAAVEVRDRSKSEMATTRPTKPI